MSEKEFKTHCVLTKDCTDLLEVAFKKLNLSAIIEQMTLNTKEIFILEELQSTVLSQLSSR